MASIEAAFVRSVPGDDFLTMVFQHAGRTYNFKRAKAEQCRLLCSRIALKIKGPSKKKKKRSAEEMDCSEGDTANPSVVILDESGAEVQGDLCSEEALQPGRVLQVEKQKFQVLRNRPGISQLKVHGPLVGCPAVADVRAEFCAAEACAVTWFLHAPQPKPPALDAESWEKAGSGRTLVASPGQAEHWVKVTASPPGGLPVSVLASGRVQAGPTEQSPIGRRHILTASPLAAPAFRVVSYNLLADLYADSAFSRSHLFAYCPESFLAHSYRQPVLLWELQGYNADLLCLQEVDAGFFEHVLRPFLGADFEAVFLAKGESTKEGVAILFRRSRFHLEQDVSLPSISAALPRLLPVDLSKSEKFAAKWAERNQCLLALRLRCAHTGRRLLLATTHLFFHPVADNVRLLQAAVCLKQLQAVRNEEDAVLLAGDFNSDPRNGVFELACEGRTRSTQSDWYSGGKEEFFGSPLIEHDLQLSSAYEPGLLHFTNYTAGFRSVLDYIFFQPQGLTLQRNIPLPSKEEVTREIALPNQLFPSDHLALISELSF